MNRPMEDAEFEAYIGRRSRLSRRYRELTAESPPKELDDAVLSLARSGQSLKRAEAPQREAYIGWMAPVAFAATIILVFTVVLQIVIRPQLAPQKEKDADRQQAPAAAVTARAASDQPRPASTRLLVEKLEQPDAAENPIADNSGSAPRSVTAEDNLKFAAPRPAEPATAETPVALAKRQATESKPTRESETAAVQPAAAAPAFGTLSASQGGAAYRRLDVKTRDPKLWLAQIERLRKEGQIAAADEQMKLFMEKFPDYFNNQPPPDSR